MFPRGDSPIIKEVSVEIQKRINAIRPRLGMLISSRGDIFHKPTAIVTAKKKSNSFQKKCPDSGVKSNIGNMAGINHNQMAG